MEYQVVINDLGFAIVSVNIKPMYSQTMEEYKFKVDSGANRTTISCDELLKLGYSEDWIKSGVHLKGDERPILASGIPLDDCYIVKLPQIAIGEWVGTNWPVLTSLSLPFKFLLGTDSMQFFNWTFDYRHMMCTFRLIDEKRNLPFGDYEQSIHSIGYSRL